MSQAEAKVTLGLNTTDVPLSASQILARVDDYVVSSRIARDLADDKEFLTGVQVDTLNAWVKPTQYGFCMSGDLANTIVPTPSPAL